MADLQNIVVYSIDDLACDHDQIASSLTETAKRLHATISGVAQFRGQVYFTFVPEKTTSETYCIVPFLEEENIDPTAELSQRWFNGFRFIALLHLSEDSTYALYGK